MIIAALFAMVKVTVYIFLTTIPIESGLRYLKLFVNPSWARRLVTGGGGGGGGSVSGSMMTV